MIPTTAKAEWHITYRCSLRCAACSRASFLNPPHTEDMTLDDAREWCRQADEVGWKNFQPEKEKARIILIGGEPTLHPLYMDFVRLAREWSGTYPQTFTNAYTPRSREIAKRSRLELDCAICTDGAKPQGSVTGPAQFPGWWMDTFVSPADAGLPSPVCYVHPSQICGLCVDHEGYSVCAIGGTVRALLGMPRTRRFADLFDRETAARMTADECRHCGYEYSKRGLPGEALEKFRAYAETCPTIGGFRMSPTWQAAFAARGLR